MNLLVNTDMKHQLYEIPFAAADLTATTETDTGFNLPAHAQVLGQVQRVGNSCNYAGC